MLGIHWARGFAPFMRASASPDMTYHGGVILPSVVSEAIFWGPKWADSTFVGDKITGLDSWHSGFSNSNYAKTSDEIYWLERTSGPIRHAQRASHRYVDGRQRELLSGDRGRSMQGDHEPGFQWLLSCLRGCTTRKRQLLRLLAPGMIAAAKRTETSAHGPSMSHSSPSATAPSGRFRANGRTTLTIRELAIPTAQVKRDVSMVTERRAF